VLAIDPKPWRDAPEVGESGDGLAARFISTAWRCSHNLEDGAVLHGSFLGSFRRE